MNHGEREWCKLVTIAFVELILELHPVKPQRVKECTQSLHDKQDTNRGTYEDNDTDNKDGRIVKPTKTKHDILEGVDGKEDEGGRERLLTPKLA